MAKFTKGHSGNPGGRPKGLSQYVQKLAGHNGKKLADILWTIATDDKEESRDRIKAVSELFDRGWNKPSQGMYFSEEMRPLVVDIVTEADVRRRRRQDAE